MSIGTTPALAASEQKCEASPSGEIGPFFTDDSAAGYHRSNIFTNVNGTSRQPGIPLQLQIKLRDSRHDCSFLRNTRIDIWQCNAAGEYSNITDQDTDGQNWLRGYQVTNNAGAATFNTIIPGWYDGRTTHIHVRITSANNSITTDLDNEHTTQLFFSQELIDDLAQHVAPYNAQGKNSITNADDQVFSEQTDGRTMLMLNGNKTHGYAAEITIVLPLSVTE